MNDLSDAEFSVAIAREAGAMLLALRESYGPIGDRIHELRNEGDRRAHVLLSDRIAEFRPDDALLSEEGKDDAARLDAFAGWLEGEIDRQAAVSPNPGRIDALHRLNRAEYQNAVRDLLSIDVDVAAMLPKVVIANI